MSKYIYSFFLVLILNLAASCDSVKKDQKVEEVQAIDVEVSPVLESDITRRVTTFGNLKAIQSVELSFKVAGHISKIYKKSGDYVKAGDKIISLNDQADQAELQSSQASLEYSQGNYRRFIELSKTGTVSQNELDKARTDVERFASQVEYQKITIAEKTISSPINGTLGAIQKETGDYVAVGENVTTVTNVNNLEIEYSLPEVYKNEVTIGQNVEVTTNIIPNKIFNAKVKFIAPEINLNTRTFLLEAQLVDHDKLLSPGMFMSVTQYLGIDKNSLIIPEQALTATVSGQQVFRYDNGQVSAVPITIGVRMPGYVQVLSGLRKGDLVVTAGQQKLQDGSRVKITSQKDNWLENLNASI